MKNMRLFLIVTITLVCMLAFAAPAFAWTHGNFSPTTDACAGCHVAHAANAPKLLKAGPTQAEFCFLCHGDGGTSAPYDVKVGKTVVGGAVYSSTAGGFVSELVGADGSGGTDTAVSSRHSVWGLTGESGYPTAEGSKVFQIPGSGSTVDTVYSFTGSGFVCASCHNPHDGGSTPDVSGYIEGSSASNDPNPRLLRKEINNGSGTNVSGLYVKFKVESVGTFTYAAGGVGTPVDSGVYVVREYVDGSTNWCGGCHTKFQTDDSDTDPGAGHAVNSLNMWRHPMNVHVIPPSDFDSSIATGTPPEMKTSATPIKKTRKLSCLTCHRAHSTTVANAGWAASWPRDSSAPTKTSNTSALLRMDNRGVCYNCHRDGKYNCWADSRIDCSKCHPGDHVITGVDCTLCHVY